MRNKILALLGLVAMMCAVFSLRVHDVQAQERSNTYFAAQFPGADVGTKITNAQASCTNTAIPCVIVVDAILAVWPQGTRPALCSNCMWLDYARVAGGLVIVGAGGLGINSSSITTNDGPLAAGLITATTGFQPATTGGANLGTTGARFSQLNIGDGSGGVRWSGTGVYTGSRILNIPDANSGTMVSAGLTTAAATSDNLSVLGATSTSHCQLTPTNASAATNIATTFVSAKTSNQITVSHAATAGMTYDVNCTGN
jgi:hypothetical protein